MSKPEKKKTVEGVEREKKTAGDFLVDLQSEIAPLLLKLKNHRLYSLLISVSEIKVFMGYHIFAVWDFMSLIKTLQVYLTCVTVPWVPTKWPKLARLVNEIVLCEESDVNEADEASSHYALYLEAMKELHLDTAHIESYVQLIREGVPVKNALDIVKCDSMIKNFVRSTFSIIDSNKTHMVAAAFAFGRETLIPEMFLRILNEGGHNKADKLTYYLQRHVDVDGDEHGPAALEMVEVVCGVDPQLWTEAAQATTIALEARIKFWDDIADAL